MRLYKREDIDDYIEQLDTIEKMIYDSIGPDNIIPDDCLPKDLKYYFIMNVTYLTEIGKLPNDDDNGYLICATNE